MSTLDLVFNYRRLIGSCDAGRGLELEEIEMVAAIESLFAAPGATAYSDRPALSTEKVSLRALMRGHRVCDPVTVVALGPNGLVCTGTPYMVDGDRFEIVFDDDVNEVSYRFSATVIWTEEDDYGELEAELKFTGTPVLVRYGATATRPASEPGLVPAKPMATVVAA